MMNLAEYRRSNTRLADFLPWAALVDEGIILNKDGSFQRTAKFRGPDLDSAVPAELVAIAGRLNNALRRLESGWAIFVEAQRHSAGSYPPNTFPDTASALVDAERRAQFEEAGAHYESSYFLTLLYLPPDEGTAKAERLLYEGSNRTVGADAREVLRRFVDRTNRVLQLIEGFMPECAWLDDHETLTYLHSTVSTKRHRVRVPEIPMYLDALLADRPLTGGLEPMLGSAHLRVLTVVGFPTATTPGILDDLNRLAFAYRWSTRAIMLDKTDATKLLTRIRRQWFAKRKSVAAILKEVMTNEASALLDTDAHNKAMDADAALQELGSDEIGEAFVTATITVWDNDPATADEKLRLVEKVIQGRDFTCMIETVNAVEAWLGSLPGACLCQRPSASYFNFKPGTYDPALSGVGRGGEGLPFQGAALVPGQDGRIDSVSLLASRRRCRTYSCGRTDWRRQIGAAGADGAPISTLSELPDLRVRFWLLGTRRHNRHGWRLA
jgi:type IV secretion system protein VirB4